VLPHKPNNKDRQKTAALLAWWSDHYGDTSLAAFSPDVIEDAKVA
jgi:hypothetical protein